MGLTLELVSEWRTTLLTCLIQTAIGNAHRDYNLDPSCKHELFYRTALQVFCRAPRNDSKREDV